MRWNRSSSEASKASPGLNSDPRRAVAGAGPGHGGDPHRSERGWTIAEALTALTIVAICLTSSFSILYGSRAAKRQLDDAELRAQIAERIMEETISLPGDVLTTRTVPLAKDLLGDRRGWTAVVQVRALKAQLRSIEVVVHGNGHQTRLESLVWVNP